MIVTKLQGGLGNQLFQWAVTKNLSLKHNCDYFFDLKYFQMIENGVVSKWNLELNNFIDINIKQNNKSLNNLFLVQDNFHYKEIFDNSYLDGYWQSEKYFKENEDIVRNNLVITEKQKEYILNKYPILMENTVSFHVRRGDYLNLKNHYTILDVDYYKRGYDLINDEKIHILVFSNDIEWCKKNFNFNNIHFIENETNIIDVYIQSMCKHNIIANSSFSWWGAWLNKNNNKMVVAPQKWFGVANAHYNTNDIYCDNWIKI